VSSVGEAGGGKRITQLARICVRKYNSDIDESGLRGKQIAECGDVDE